MLKNLNKKWQPYYEKIEHEFPKPINKVLPEEDFMVEMRDDIKLNTRVFKPDIDGPYKVLFTRNPYSANTELLEAIYIPFVEQGYCLIIQDCRGTGESEGDWQPFKNERNDGIDSLNWLNNQKWVDSIATFGRSYSAYTQWIVGDKLPAKVKTMFLEVYGINRFDQVYSNGLFREDIYTSWAFQNSLVKSSLPVNEQYQQALRIYPAIERDEKILHTKLQFYRDYLTHINKSDDYWKDSIWSILESIPSKINVPVVVTDGWADHHLQGSILGYEKLNNSIKSKSRLIITPTDHMSDVTGNLNYPNANKYGTLNLKANLIWFNHIMKGNSKDLESGCYQMGTGNWMDPNILESSKKESLYLSVDNTLKDTENNDVKYHFDYDPTHPNNWPAGNELLAWIAPGFTDKPHGFIKTKEYPTRNDVLKFESKQFENGLCLAGNITVQLKVDTNVDDTAFAVRIVEKTKSGDFINIKDGISSLSINNGNRVGPHEPGKPQIIRISLGNIVWQIKPGSKIVLLISSSNFPMYAIHHNKYGLWSKQQLNSVIAHQIVLGGNDSYLSLPIIKGQDNNNE